MLSSLSDVKIQERLSEHEAWKHDCTSQSPFRMARKAITSDDPVKIPVPNPRGRATTILTAKQTSAGIRNRRSRWPLTGEEALCAPTPDGSIKEQSQAPPKIFLCLRPATHARHSNNKPHAPCTSRAQSSSDRLKGGRTPELLLRVVTGATPYIKASRGTR